MWFGLVGLEWVYGISKVVAYLMPTTSSLSLSLSLYTHTHTHTHTYMNWLSMTCKQIVCRYHLKQATDIYYVEFNASFKKYSLHELCEHKQEEGINTWILSGYVVWFGLVGFEWVWHRWRSRDALISNILLWTPSHGRAKAGWPARTYIQQVCADTGCSLNNLPGPMDVRDGWRERVREICADGMTRWWWWWYINTCGLNDTTTTLSLYTHRRTHIQIDYQWVVSK